MGLGEPCGGSQRRRIRSPIDAVVDVGDIRNSLSSSANNEFFFNRENRKKIFSYL